MTFYVTANKKQQKQNGWIIKLRPNWTAAVAAAAEMDEIRLDWQMFNMTATTATVARQAHTRTLTHLPKNGNIQAAKLCIVQHKGNATHIHTRPVRLLKHSEYQRAYTFFFVIYMLILMIIPWPNKEEKERMWWLALLFFPFFRCWKLFGWMETKMGEQKSIVQLK